MTRQRSLKTIAAAASATLLAISIFGASGVSAAQPGWKLTVTELPSAVSPGADAGYRVLIENLGPSNISQLFFTDSVDAVPTFFTSTRAGCAVDPRLFCTFGALNSGDSITVVIAYATPLSGAATFDVTFELNTTGKTFSDKGKNSHGDAKQATASTDLNSDQNFAGGFIDGSFSVANGGTLGRRNIQSTSATGSGNGVPVTVQDGSGASAACAAALQNPLGECSEVNVAEGAVVGGLITIVITIFDKNVPNNIDVGEVFVSHTFTLDGVTTTFAIVTHCPPEPVAADCLSAELLANGDLQITVYVDHNGGFKPGLR